MSTAACAISGGTIRRGLVGCSSASSHTLLSFPNDAALFSKRRATRSFAVGAAVSDPLEVCVKASVTVLNELGDFNYFGWIHLSIRVLFPMMSSLVRAQKSRVMFSPSSA